MLFKIAALVAAAIAVAVVERLLEEAARPAPCPDREWSGFIEAHEELLG